MKNTIILTVIGLIAVTGLVLSVTGNKAPINEMVGSVTGPDDSFECKTTNGVQTCNNRVAIRNATTTPCSIKSPGATSTVSFAGIHMNRVSDDGVATFDVGIGTTPFATTSTGLMNSNSSLATGPVQGSFLFGTTTYQTVAPNSFLVVKFSTSTLSSNFSLSGSCEATFIKL